MKRTQHKLVTRERRATAVRGKLKASGQTFRFSVFRSNKDLYIQVINDELGATVASGSLHEVASEKKKVPGARVERAHALGKLVAERARKAGVSAVVFDRGRYAYHGRVKAIAEGARAGGLKL